MNPSSFTGGISVKIYEIYQEMRGGQPTGVKDKQRHLRLCCQTAFCCTRTNLLRHGKSYLCITRETASRTITLRLNFGNDLILTFFNVLLFIT